MNRLAVFSFFQSCRRNRRRLSRISPRICQISKPIFDRRHVNDSHDVPACKVIDVRIRTMNKLCVRRPNSRVSGQRKWRMESENGFRSSFTAGSLGLNNQTFLLTIDPRQSMRSGFFLSGSICPSTPFERHLRSTSPSKRATESENLWRLSNTDDLVYVFQRAVFSALRWRSNERGKKLSNRLPASSFFQSF